MATILDWFAPCPRGLEASLAEELSALGGKDCVAAEGGVHAQGDWAFCVRANLWSRLASRILWKLGQRPYQKEHHIYAFVYELPWENWINPQQTLRVDVSAKKSPLKSLEFITLKIKDGICDRMREKLGSRPDISTEAPDCRVFAFLEKDQCHLYLDTTGEALFKRGWREQTGDAPLRENLAAGLLHLAGWKPEIPLLDAFCGSGTILAEALMIASDMAPGWRRSFALEKYRFVPHQLMRSAKEEALDRAVSPKEIRLFGSDKLPSAVSQTKAHLRKIGLSQPNIQTFDIAELSRPCSDNGIWISNPPYGVRLSDQHELALLYPILGQTMKQAFSGWSVYLLSGDLKLPQALRLKEKRKTPLFNGALECRLFAFDMVAGSHRTVKKDAPHAD